MLWQYQCVSSRLCSQLSFIPVIGSHHKKSLTKTDWKLVPTMSNHSNERYERGLGQRAQLPTNSSRDWEVFDINNVLDNRAPWCLSVIIRSFLIFSLRVVARLNCQHSAPCWGVRTRQARPAITTGGYKAETTLQTPLVQVEFFRNQHEGDLGACCKVLLDKICWIK